MVTTIMFALRQTLLNLLLVDMLANSSPNGSQERDTIEYQDGACPISKHWSNVIENSPFDCTELFYLKEHGREDLIVPTRRRPHKQAVPIADKNCPNHRNKAKPPPGSGQGIR